MLTPVSSSTLYLPEVACRVEALGPGRLDGAPISFGPRNSLVVTGPGARSGTSRVRAEVSSWSIETHERQSVGTFEGDVPTRDVAALGPTDAPPLAAEGHAIAPAEIPLRAEPRGPVVYTVRMPQEVRVQVVRRVPGQAAIRVGDGPYLYGWTDVALEPIPGSGTPTGLRTRDGSGPRLPVGARIEVRPGLVVTTVERLLVTRRETRPDGRTVIEVDGDVALSGLVAPGVMPAQ